MPAHEEQTLFPHPWTGGWWRLRDIVTQQQTATWALLDIAARGQTPGRHAGPSGANAL